MSEYTRDQEPFRAIAHVAKGLLDVKVTPRFFRVVTRTTKSTRRVKRGGLVYQVPMSIRDECTLLHCEVLVARYGFHKGETVWIDRRMIKTVAEDVQSRTKTQRRKDQRRKAAMHKAEGTYGRMAQGSERTERTEVQRTEGQADASQDVTVAPVSVANILECQQCWSEVHAPIGADTAVCSTCKAE